MVGLGGELEISRRTRRVHYTITTTDILLPHFDPFMEGMALLFSSPTISLMEWGAYGSSAHSKEELKQAHLAEIQTRTQWLERWEWQRLHLWVYCVFDVWLFKIKAVDHTQFHWINAGPPVDFINHDSLHKVKFSSFPTHLHADLLYYKEL